MLSLVDSATLRVLGLRRADIKRLVAVDGWSRVAHGWFWTGPGPVPSDALAVALLAAVTVRSDGPVVSTFDGLGRGPGLPLVHAGYGRQPPLVLGGSLGAAGLDLALVPRELPAVAIGRPGSAGFRWQGVVGARVRLEPSETVVHRPAGVTALYREGVRQALPWIPVTSIVRTVQDAVAHLSDLQLLWLVEQALARYPGTDLLKGATYRGRRRLAPLLPRAEPRSRSPLETATRLLLLDAGLPRPESNVRVLPGIVCDLVWAEARVIVECDGLAWHLAPSVVSKDAVRNRALQRAGWTVIRVTWDDVRNRPAELVLDLTALLTR